MELKVSLKPRVIGLVLHFKQLPAMLAFLMIAGSSPSCFLPLTFLLMSLGKQQRMTQSWGPLLPTWVTWKKFLATGFSPAQSWPYEPAPGRSLSLTLYLWNKSVLKKKNLLKKFQNICLLKIFKRLMENAYYEKMMHWLQNCSKINPCLNFIIHKLLM